MYFNNGRFIEVNIELTNSCNFDCWFCPRRAMTRELGYMEYEKFKEMILSLKKASFLREIALAGIGEPTLHPDLVKMISFIKDNTPFKVVLTTNASKFKDRLFVNELFKSGVDKVTISLRFLNENKSYFSSANSYEEYITAILDFVETQYRFNYKTEIELSFFKETYYSKYILGIETKEFIDVKRLNYLFQALSKILGKDLLPYGHFTKNIPAHLSNVDRIPIKDGFSLRFDSLSSWTTARGKFKKSKKTCYKSRYGSCLGLLTHFAIYWNGAVSTCCADFDVKNILGNIFEEKDIIEILSSLKAVSFATSLRKKIMPTETCQICRGGDSLLEKLANIAGTIFYVK